MIAPTAALYEAKTDFDTGSAPLFGTRTAETLRINDLGLPVGVKIVPGV